MNENKGLEFLDFLIIIAKWKKFLIATFLTLVIISYMFVYFFVEEEFDAKALIIPSEQSQLGGFSSLLKDFSSLPLNLGGISSRNDIDLYNTIIYSRTNLEKIIKKYNLVREYKTKNIEETIKILSKKINTDETEESAFQIVVRANNPSKAANMTNFIVDELNRKVISMNVTKSRDNRIFLENRKNEIIINLKNAEDSLRHFQEKSGLYVAEDQVKSLIGAYTKLESELAVRQVQQSVYAKIYGETSPVANNFKIETEQFEEKLNDMKKGQKNSLFSGLKDFPLKGMEYIRLFREVKINEAMLEFIMPMYEQAKFEEQKELPILQVIDYAVPPVKRSSPQRILISFAISLSIIFLILLVIIIKSIIAVSANPKLKIFKEELVLKKNI